MVITFDFTSRTTNLTPDKPMSDCIRQIDIHRDYAPMCIGNFNDDIDWGDVEQLSDNLAMCLAVTSLFRPEHKEMVYEWANSNLKHIDPLRVADRMAEDVEALFALNASALEDYTSSEVPSERKFNHTVDALSSWAVSVDDLYLKI